MRLPITVCILLAGVWLVGLFVNEAVGALDPGGMHSGSVPHGDETFSGGSWEGSPSSKTYSEQNHQWAGMFLLLIGLSELGGGSGAVSKWIRGALPAAMVGTGVLLIIWSDHEAWPIGRLSFSETFWGDDWEIVQHKMFAVSSLTVGIIEGGLKLGWIVDRRWARALPLYAVAGGLLLLLHDHGHHPQAEAIATHHTLMGILSMAAGGAKWLALDAAPRHSFGVGMHHRGAQAGFLWTAVWSGLVLGIGLLLLVYRE